MDKKQKDSTNSIEADQLKFLQEHGITMIPMEEDSTIVENAMESGQTVVLTEAGKLALNLTRSPNLNSVKRLQLKKPINKKIITIRADQLLAKNFSPRAPNILKKVNHHDNKIVNKIF